MQFPQQYTTLVAIKISATNKWIMSLKQKQRSLFSTTNKMCVCACVRVSSATKQN
jgi:hypothetical protein